MRISGLDDDVQIYSYTQFGLYYLGEQLFCVVCSSEVGLRVGPIETTRFWFWPRVNVAPKRDTTRTAEVG